MRAVHIPCRALHRLRGPGIASSISQFVGVTMKPIHLGWFHGNSFGVHGWKQPWAGTGPRDWYEPDLHIDLARALELGTPASLGLTAKRYAVATLHRPSNVDDPAVLSRLLRGIQAVERRVPVIFPVHPRTLKTLATLKDQLDAMPNLRRVEPQGYLDFLCLTSQARLVLTDSGGLQEETTALGVPCLTLRENTERPITVTEGTNTVVGTDADRIATEGLKALDGQGKAGRTPALWDGKAGERIAEVYERFLKA